MHLVEGEESEQPVGLRRSEANSRWNSEIRVDGEKKRENKGINLESLGINDAGNIGVVP